MDGDRRASEISTSEGAALDKPAASTGGEGVKAGAKEWGRHPVNIRISVPLGIGRYYITIVAGRERRSRERRVEERRKHPLVSAGNLGAFFTLGVICGLAALAVIQFGAAYVLLRSGVMVVGQ